MKRWIIGFFLLTPTIALGDVQGVTGNFRGLHNSDSSMVIDDNEAQDVSNVDFLDNGNGIKKRSGYAQFLTIGLSTYAVHGGYFFRDVSGNDTVIFTNYTYIQKSVNSAAFSAFLTDDTADSYYDFTDSQGYLWRANTARDRLFKYDGTTVTDYLSAPKGNQIEVLPDRLVISGTSANPNRIYFSAASDFGTFTTGPLETDAFTEDIGLPGQAIAAIKVACGGLLAWTKDTMSFWQGTNQYDGTITQISNNLGTKQPGTVLVDLGKVFWQAQDNHFYSYDCNTISRISQKLDVSGFAGGESKQWLQTTQSDFAAGTNNQTSASITSGSVLLSTWTDTDTTDANFNAGSLSNLSVISNSVYLSTNNSNTTNNSFESALSSGWGGGTFWNLTTSCTGGSVSPQDGSNMVRTTPGSTPSSLTVSILDSSGNVLTSSDFTVTTSWQQGSISLSSYVGRNIKIKFNFPAAGVPLTSDLFFCSGTTISFYYARAIPGSSCGGVGNAFGFALLDYLQNGQSTIYSGSFTSRSFDTALSNNVWGSASATYSANSHTMSFQTQASSDGSSWDTAASWTPASAPTSAGKRYLRYIVSMSTATAGTGLPHLDDATFISRASTGTFVSQDKQIGTAATSFGSFNVNQTLNSGTISYYIRTATSQGGLSAASRTALTNQSLITATIRPWIRVEADFTAATYSQNPQLDDFTVQWNEGSVSRNQGIVDKNHRLLWTVAEGVNTVPSATYIYDQRFDSWLKYSVALDAPARVGDAIYFGSTTSGTVYTFPSGNTDNGSAFTAYWKSKDFVGSDPFVEKDFLSYGLLAKTQSGSNLDVIYTINTTASTTANHSLTDPNSLTLRRINANFPSGKFGTFINFRIGNDDADAPFEFYGFKFDYRLRPWRVLQ